MALQVCSHSGVRRCEFHVGSALQVPHVLECIFALHVANAWQNLTLHSMVVGAYNTFRQTEQGSLLLHVAAAVDSLNLQQHVHSQPLCFFFFFFHCCCPCYHTTTTTPADHRHCHHGHHYKQEEEEEEEAITGNGGSGVATASQARSTGGGPAACPAPSG